MERKKLKQLRFNTKLTREFEAQTYSGCGRKRKQMTTKIIASALAALCGL